MMNVFLGLNLLGFVSVQLRATATDSGCYDDIALSGKMLNHFSKSRMVFNNSP